MHPALGDGMIRRATMSRKPRKTKPFVAAIVGITMAVIGLFLLEGVVSLFSGRSLLRSALDDTTTLRQTLTDQQRAKMANLTEGPYQLDLDPVIGHRTKASASHEWNGVPATTDIHGMRKRVDGWPEASRPKWVVLGDSVAFGLGVADDQTYAARIEAHLANVWGDDSPSPAVLTVGVPGWSLASSTRFLRNHLERYDPDLVVLMPVRNDLENRSVVTASGQRADGVDPGFGATRIYANYNRYMDLYLALAPRAPVQRVAAAVADGGRDAVDYILRTGLAPESRRRWQGAMSFIAQLRAVLDARGAKMAVISTWGSNFATRMQSELHRGLPGITEGVLFDMWRKEDALVGDAHANATCIDAGAIRMLQILADGGMLPAGCDLSSLSLPESYAKRTVAPHDAASLKTWLRERRAVLEKYCGPTIRLADATGFQQIYGGIEPDGTMASDARMALLGTGVERTLLLKLRRPAHAAVLPGLKIGCSFAEDPGKPDTEPVWVAFPTGGGDDRDVIHELRVPVPEGISCSGWIDVHLTASDRAVETVKKRSRLVSCRVVEVELVR